VKSPLSITPSNKPCGNHFAKDHQKITSIQTMRPAPGDSVGSEQASQNCPSGKSVRLATKMPLNPLERFEEDPAAQALYKMQN